MKCLNAIGICYLCLAALWITTARRTVAAPQRNTVSPQTSLKPVHSIEKDRIIVWRYFPRTPCHITTDNPTCPAGDGIPGEIWLGKIQVCRDEATCNPLSAAELLIHVPGKKIVDTHYYATEGNRLSYANFFDKAHECIISTQGCPISYCRWEQVAPGYGHFKNWSDSKDRTAAIVATLGDK